MISNEDLKKMSELDVIRLIKDPNTPPKDYNTAAEFLVKKYSPMIHKHWWTLQRQMDNSDLVNSLKDEYYSEAYEALFVAIQKVDLSKIYDENFKLMQLASWYITNVRTKFIKETRKKAKIKTVSSMKAAENEADLTVDPDVEVAYWESGGYKINPEYQVCEIQEGENICNKAIDACMQKWSAVEREIFKYLQKGTKKKKIANLLGLSPIKVYSYTTKMKQDMKVALGVA